jgi:hypothetical protein
MIHAFTPRIPLPGCSPCHSPDMHPPIVLGMAKEGWKFFPESFQGALAAAGIVASRDLGNTYEQKRLPPCPLLKDKDAVSIPRHFHFIWCGSVCGDQKQLASFREQHPESTIFLWTDIRSEWCTPENLEKWPDVREFLTFCEQQRITCVHYEGLLESLEGEKFPYLKEGVDYFIKTSQWGALSDVLRILALKKYGGVYADTDRMLFHPMDFFMDAGDFICVGHRNKHVSYEHRFSDDIEGNDFLGSIPEHSILERCLCMMNERLAVFMKGKEYSTDEGIFSMVKPNVLNPQASGRTAVYLTGPSVLQSVLFHFLSQEETNSNVVVLPQAYFHHAMRVSDERHISVGCPRVSFVSSRMDMRFVSDRMLSAEERAQNICDGFVQDLFCYGPSVEVWCKLHKHIQSRHVDSAYMLSYMRLKCAEYNLEKHPWMLACSVGVVMMSMLCDKPSKTDLILESLIDEKISEKNVRLIGHTLRMSLSRLLVSQCTVDEIEQIKECYADEKFKKQIQEALI